MKAAIYLRVSTEKQDELNQEPDCLRLCTARGWEPVPYRERASGTKATRPVWRQLVEDVRLGKVQAVAFWALDRTGRNRVQVAQDLGDLFRWGAEVTSVKDSWLDQARGPMRDLLVQVMGWVAEGERARLVERTRAGLDRARAEGKTLGRPRVAVDVARARALFAETKSVAAVARALGVARATLSKALSALSEKGP